MSTEKQNQYLDYLIDPSFQGVNRLFVLPFENEAQQISYKRYYLLTVEVKNYNIMIDGQNFFDHPVRNNLITYGSVRKIIKVKEMITQLVVCWTIIISKTIIR